VAPLDCRRRAALICNERVAQVRPALGQVPGSEERRQRIGRLAGGFVANPALRAGVATNPTPRAEDSPLRSVPPLCPAVGRTE